MRVSLKIQRNGIVCGTIPEKIHDSAVELVLVLVDKIAYYTSMYT